MVVPTQSQFAWSLDGKQDTMAAKKVSGNATLDQPYEYAAITDLYFAAAMMPDVPARAWLVTLHHTIDLPSDLSDLNSPKKRSTLLGWPLAIRTATHVCAFTPVRKRPTS